LKGSSPDEDQERLNSRKAVVAMLTMALVVLFAAGVFLWVVLSRACSAPVR
jgi:hypothetical protein